MKFESMIVMILTIFISCSSITNQSISSVNIIEGIYLDQNRSQGIKIEKLQNGNYIFTRVYTTSTGEIEEAAEFQSAYVIPNGKKCLYYWHTGRKDDTPDTDSIIVYDMIYENNSLYGTYYFPTSPNQPLWRVKYIYDNEYSNMIKE